MGEIGPSSWYAGDVVLDGRFAQIVNMAERDSSLRFVPLAWRAVLCSAGLIAVYNVLAIVALKLGFTPK
jgi:hypothetical protein